MEVWDIEKEEESITALDSRKFLTEEGIGM